MTQYRKPIPKNQSEITQEAIGVPFIKNEVKKTTLSFQKKKKHSPIKPTK